MGILLLITGMLLNLVLPTTAYAEEKAKRVVRVGWHEPPYFLMDESGRMSGYSYEYQRKVAAYTGWEYEYVEGTWSDLMQMLKEGKIDLMSDVSYLPERKKICCIPPSRWVQKVITFLFHPIIKKSLQRTLLL
jgi:ABC-type amino acid transport substrate-binding protein